MPVAVIIDWYGPYNSFERFKSEAILWEKNSKMLYMGIGNPSKGTNIQTVDYLGLSTSPASRFQNHHKLRDESLACFYLSEIRTAGIPGRRSKKTVPDLDAAEGALISALQPRLNERRKTPPRDCVVVYSRFFGKNNPEKPKLTPFWFPALVAYNSYTGQWEK